MAGSAVVATAPLGPRYSRNSMSAEMSASGRSTMLVAF